MLAAGLTTLFAGGAWGQYDDIWLHDWLQYLGSLNSQGTDGSTYDDRVNALAVGPDGYITAVGWFTGSLRDRAGVEIGPVHGDTAGAFVLTMPPDDPSSGVGRMDRYIFRDEPAQGPPEAGAAAAYAVAMAPRHRELRDGTRPVAVGGEFWGTVDFCVESDWGVASFDVWDGWLLYLDAAADECLWICPLRGEGLEHVEGADISEAISIVPQEDPESGEEILVAFVAAAGWFGTDGSQDPSTPDISFDSTDDDPSEETNGGEDAFLVLLAEDAQGIAEYVTHIAFGGTGDDRAYDVQSVKRGNTLYYYVAGSFSGSSVDFDPDHSHSGNIDIASSAGGTDIFVAKYVYDPIYNNDLELVWLYTDGSTGNDLGRALVCSGGAVYVTGSTWDNGSLALWTAQLLEDSDEDEVSLQWENMVSGSWAEEGRDIDLISPAAVVVTGYFGKYRGAGDANCSECIQYSLDFDPDSAYQDVHTTNKGFDSFLTSYSTGGSYLWTRTFGDDWNETGTGVAVDASTKRLTHAGRFGDLNASPSYSIDFYDPGSQIPADSAVSRGRSDGYVQSLAPEMTEIWQMLSLLIDTSHSLKDDDTDDPDYTGDPEVDCDEDGVGEGFQKITQALVDILEDESALMIPRDGSVAVNVIYFGRSEGAQTIVPFIRIDAEDDIELLVRAIERSHALDGNTDLAAGMEYAAGELGNGLTYLDPVHIAVNILVEGKDNLITSVSQLQDARDALVAAGAHQVNALGIESQFSEFGGVGTNDIAQYLEDYVCWGKDGEVVDYPAIDGPGFYLLIDNVCDESPDPNLFDTWLLKTFTEITGCPEACQADITGPDDEPDCLVNQSDLGFLLACYDPDNPASGECLRADLDSNQYVDQGDLGILLAEYAAGCGN